MHESMGSRTSEIKSEGPELTHLLFVRAIAIGIFICASSLYDYAKQNHWILMFPARMVEFPVRIALGLVCNIFPNLPDDLWVIADNVVDRVAPRVDARTPKFAKRLMRPLKVVANKVMFKGVVASNYAQANGPKDAARYVAGECKAFVIISTAKWWVYLNQFCLIRAFAALALPGVAALCRTYHRFIEHGTSRGYPLARFLPAIPTLELADAVLCASRHSPQDLPVF